MNCFLLFACCNLDDVPIRMFSTFAEAENAAMSMPPEPPEINPLIAWDTSGFINWKILQFIDGIPVAVTIIEPPEDVTPGGVLVPGPLLVS